jgi:hypothetical protein
MTPVALAVSSYFMVGAYFMGYFRDFASLFLWPFVLDIYISGESELRRIARDEKRQIAKIRKGE